MVLIEEWEISITPGQLGIVIRIASSLPGLAFVKEPGLFKLVKLSKLLGRHGLLFAGQDFVHLRGAVKRATQNEVAQILLVLERIGLGKHTAIRVPQQTDSPQPQRLADSLHILHHVLDCTWW